MIILFPSLFPLLSSPLLSFSPPFFLFCPVLKSKDTQHLKEKYSFLFSCHLWTATFLLCLQSQQWQSISMWHTPPLRHMIRNISYVYWFSVTWYLCFKKKKKGIFISTVNNAVFVIWCYFYMLIFTHTHTCMHTTVLVTHQSPVEKRRRNIEYKKRTYLL